MLINGSFIDSEELIAGERDVIDVLNPYNQEKIGHIFCATRDEVVQAVENAHEVFQHTMKKMPAHRRSQILRNTADLLELRKEAFAELLTLEAGKPIVEARGEVARAIQVLHFAAEGAKNLHGEQIVLDNAIGGEQQFGFSKRVPLGVVAAITPFNFPLNMALHKIAPAIAAGNTIVIKPAEKTPFSTVALYKLFLEAGLPSGALNIIQGPGQNLVEPLVTHPLVKKVTFTGSGAVGWKIHEMAKGKKVTLELGSNAPNIIFDDANIDNAVSSILMGGFTFAGQACVSAQRIFVHESVYDEFLNKLTEKVSALRMGDPKEESTQLGPMITEEAAKKAELWIQEAVEAGAVICTGGTRNGTFLEPTILENVDLEMKVVCQEVFAPIIAIVPFDTEEEVVNYANDSRYGLQAGVFTNNINLAMRVAESLETGGVWINEASVKRYDHIPYGGVKESGIGKEGIHYAIEEMTDLKFIGMKILSRINGQ
ncbi:aldehyde dehydrogenase family protein [Psychrobacillus lasiicapitis]|uniref:Salicylaldehyde dehydrogenase n=1 Tax=Psychrobacillus lasiicapitis TaxID=1636719 RepID=A0A544T8S5_9BACI|nr:aldehyde dehydrogenase family protein [Psychrobacillus lasiicapitis]TQR13845.1 aldehyde dehydrogenase family protein [Psychrobacillus lasiicapitis]GGA35876.1 aldehyde dehydrogenase [Psychrobacillus lasiicapitis]